MTKEDRNNKLKHFITCLKCEVSGKCCDDNCSTQYDAGNMSEIIENLEAISKVLEQESITKNDSGVDLISRADVLKLMQDNWHSHSGDWAMQESMDDIRALPSVTPQLSSELDKNSKKLEKDFGELDCISRKAVIDELKRYFHNEYYQRTSIQDCRDCFIEDVLNHLPSVIPQEPRKGHWITRPHIYGVAFCSECGFELKINNTNYCPNCGADMRSKAESENKE